MKPTRRIEISEQVMLCLPESYTKPLLRGLDGWVKALRSGDYKQGRNLLCYEGAYCCLGVLCKLQGRPSQVVNGRTVYDGDIAMLNWPNPMVGVFGGTGHFPSGVWCEVGDPVRGVETLSDLAVLNDKGATFEQIADVISRVWADDPTPADETPGKAA